MNSPKKKSYLIPFIVAINVVVFVFWNFPILPNLSSEFMARHFLVSWTALIEQRYDTLIGSVFSHNQFLHLFLNMFVLLNFGRIVEMILGWRRFLKFYLLAGIISSLCHALVSAYILHEPSLPALGASGAISGIVILFAFLFPKEKIYIMGLIGLPAIWGAIAFIALDIWGLVAQAEGGGLPIGHGAHLGGAVTGILYYFFFLRKQILKSRAVSELS